MPSPVESPPFRVAFQVLAVAAIGGIAALVAGCGDDENPGVRQVTAIDRRDDTSTSAVAVSPRPQEQSPTSGMSPTTTEAPATSLDSDGRPEAVDQLVITAYVGYWEARLRANTGTPNPHEPSLAQYATGNQLDAVIAETQKNLDEDRAFQPAPNPADFRRVTVVSVEGDRAEVQECFVDDTQVVERSTGRVLNDAVSTQSVVGTLRLLDGSWRVSGSELVQRWEGVAGCALAS